MSKGPLIFIGIAKPELIVVLEILIAEMVPIKEILHFPTNQYKN